ncbi:DnaJ-domain-containing protein [Exidia glandulosa HHB12029]|uniref:DnaJ-domain-containing protein n=1 Tax=Exidia glandulosa HHB12029 TaxID=1314781 RepID=A0A165HKM0_EXIGL|nr:DnaJ-domain-containing protein [Exidia glandulosa HHB12029]
MSSFPNYYTLLNVPKSATQDEIRQAYKRESLRCHPDRLGGNATADETRRATEKFQAVADAYYVLSDPIRRKEYDDLLRARGATDTSTDPDASESFFANFAQYFANATGGGANGAAAGAAAADPPPRPNAEHTFGDVFEDLLRPEVESRVNIWKYLGMASGAGMGFIIANLPGMFVGGLAGSKLGAIRDAKGKSVAAVFSDLGGEQKAEILRALAMKVLGTAL